MKQSILKHLLLAFTAFYAFDSIAQSTFKEWSERDQIAKQANSRSGNNMSKALKDQVGITIESVLDVSDVKRIDGKKYAVLHAQLYRKFPITLLEKPNETDGALRSNTEQQSKDRIQQMLLEKYGKDNFRVSSSYVKILVPTKVFCFYLEGHEEQGSQWVFIPELKKTNDLYLSTDIITRVQKVLHRNIPEPVLAELENEQNFFNLEDYVNDFKELNTANLNDAIALYLASSADKNVELEMAWTHNKLRAYVQKEGQSSGQYGREIESQGILLSLLQVDTIQSVSKIIKNKQTRYASVLLKGKKVMDYSMYQNEGGMGMAVGYSYMAMVNEFGEDRVSLDEKSWTITVTGIEQRVYAIEDVDVAGWRFTILPFIPTNEDVAMEEYDEYSAEEAYDEQDAEDAAEDEVEATEDAAEEYAEAATEEAVEEDVEAAAKEAAEEYHEEAHKSGKKPKQKRKRPGKSKRQSKKGKPESKVDYTGTFTKEILKSIANKVDFIVPQKVLLKLQ